MNIINEARDSGPAPRRGTIEEFADAHGLEMLVEFWPSSEGGVGDEDDDAGYYTAQFDGEKLRLAGRGQTEEEAIADYASYIRGKMLFFMPEYDCEWFVYAWNFSEDKE